MDEKGFVTGLKEGTVTITTSLQGKHVKKQSVIITEKKPEATPVPTPVITPKPMVTPRPTVSPIKPSESPKTVQKPKVTSIRKIKAKFIKGDKLQMKKKGKWKTVYIFKKGATEKKIGTTGTYRVKRKKKTMKTSYLCETQIIPRLDGTYVSTTLNKQVFKGNFKKGTRVQIKINKRWKCIYTLTKESKVISIYGSSPYCIIKKR